MKISQDYTMIKGCYFYQPGFIKFSLKKKSWNINTVKSSILSIMPFFMVAEILSLCYCKRNETPLSCLIHRQWDCGSYYWEYWEYCSDRHFWKSVHVGEMLRHAKNIRGDVKCPFLSGFGSQKKREVGTVEAELPTGSTHSQFRVARSRADQTDEIKLDFKSLSLFHTHWLILPSFLTSLCSTPFSPNQSTLTDAPPSCLYSPALFPQTGSGGWTHASTGFNFPDLSHTHTHTQV